MNKIKMRWVCQRDMPNLLRIEYGSFPAEHAWTEDDFLTHLRDRVTIGMVAEIEDQIVGYMIYGLRKNHLEVLNFAVDPECRRQGIGRVMAKRLYSKLEIVPVKRHYVLFRVRETNLAMQLFLRANGYTCESIYEGFYLDCDESAYQFTKFLDGIEPYEHVDPVESYSGELEDGDF